MKRWMGLTLCALMLALNASAQTSQLEVVFLQAGKADAIIILSDNSTVLIDAGEHKMGKDILTFLEDRQVESIDVMLITHFDKDHVGGADKVLLEMPVGVVYQPSYPKDSKQFRQYQEALEQAKVPVVSLTENWSMELDGVAYHMDVANKQDYGKDEENDFSLVTSLRFGQHGFLFAGDAENQRLAELLVEGNLSHDVLKVPHHGRLKDLSPAFFQAVGPQYAIITSGDEQREDAAVPLLLRQLGAQVYLTREGQVSILSDGEEFHISR